MSRRCTCISRCRHLVRGSGDPLLPPEKLTLIDDPILRVLLDAADAYDADSLQFDPACGLHGERMVSNEECVCRGERTSAAEFVQALELYVRVEMQRQRNLPAGRPNASRPHDPRLSLALAG